MKIKRIFTASVAAVALLGTTACVTDPNTGERKISRTAIGGVGGALGGYLLGGLIGGNPARIAGAVAGGAIGGDVGYRMDEQIRELEEATAGSGVDVSQIPGEDAFLVNLPDVTFATGSSVISPSFQATLNQVADSLVRYPNSLIDVYGHTDSTGSDSYNQGLSERRAASVADYLAGRGIQRARMATLGYGESQLKCSPEQSEADYQCNRRVEIRIAPVTQADVNAAQ